MALYKCFREDGWPYCPNCGEDELWSSRTPATITSIVGCYYCGWRKDEVRTQDIGWAIEQLRAGRAVTRRGWNGKGQHLVHHPYPVDKDRLPWVSITTVDNQVVPWTCSQTDLLAEDWEIV